MRAGAHRTSMIILYALGSLLLAWFLIIFFYQYIIAIQKIDKILPVFANPRILSALWISVSSSCITALLSIFFGVPLAYIFAVKNIRYKSLLETLMIDVPQTFPPVAEGIILFMMLGPDSPFGINIAYTYLAIVLAKTFVCTPFVVSFAARKFRETQTTGADITAKTLGASESQVFWTIFVPIAFKDIIAGTALCWARGMGELGGSLIFAGIIPFKTEDIPTFIAVNSSALIPALAATILATTASLLALLSFKAFTKERTTWKGFF